MSTATTTLAYRVKPSQLQRIMKALEDLRRRLAQRGLRLAFNIVEENGEIVIELEGDEEALQAAAELLERLGATPA